MLVFFASLAVMRGVNFNLNQSGGNVDEASCIPTGTDKQRNAMERNEKKERNMPFIPFI